MKTRAVIVLLLALAGVAVAACGRRSLYLDEGRRDGPSADHRPSKPPPPTPAKPPSTASAPQGG